MADADYSSLPVFSRAPLERGAHPAAEVAPDARTAECTFLRRLADIGQDVVAERAGISACRVSRWKNSASDGGGLHMSEVTALIAAMELTLVDCRPGEMSTVPTAYLEALVTLAKRALG